VLVAVDQCHGGQQDHRAQDHGLAESAAQDTVIRDGLALGEVGEDDLLLAHLQGIAGARADHGDQDRDQQRADHRGTTKV
jgi:hypothetical protein